MLGRAKTLMRGWVGPTPPAATPYRIACANGHWLRGNRTEGYQALRCPSCAEAVFVLPQSPLPEPPVPAAASSSPKSRPSREAILDAYTGDDAPHALVDPPAWSPPPAPAPSPVPGPSEGDDEVADIDWVDAVEEPVRAKSAPASPPESPRSPPAAAAVPHRPTPARPHKVRTASAAPSPESPAVITEPRPTLREWVTSHRNPLLAIGLVLVVVGAVSVKRWRQRLEELPRIAEIGRTEGFKKLDAGDFFAAKKILADAAAAVNAMGGRFEGSDAIRHAALEAAIFTDLVPRTLEELVEEAATSDLSDPKAWSTHFASMYKGRSIIVETTITAVPDPNKPDSRYEDAYRIVVGRGPKPEATGRIDYRGFQLIEVTQPKVGETKLFGARLAGLEFDLAAGLWVFTLEPESGVFMTHPDALASIHWPVGALEEDSPP